MTMVDASWYVKPKGSFPTRLAAGGIIVRRDQGKIFIALILEGRFKDFALPKGGVKTGEEIEDAARREILEEAGIEDLTKLDYYGIRERLNISKTKWITVHYFLFQTDQKSGSPTDQTQSHVRKWFPIDELPRMQWPEQRKLIEDNREKIKERMLNVEE